MGEILDIVNDMDEVVGNQERSKFYEQGLSNFRVINGFLKNNRGELWIPRRTSSKKLFPLHLDVSVGGHVKSCESYKEAFARELLEELNIDANKVLYKQIGYFTPHKDHVSAFMTVYEIETNLDPDFNKNDFIEATWITPNCLADLIIKGEPAKGDLIKLINLCFNKNG